jgi:hypothetical protein
MVASSTKQTTRDRKNSVNFSAEGSNATGRPGNNAIPLKGKQTTRGHESACRKRYDENTSTSKLLICIAEALLKTEN